MKDVGAASSDHKQSHVVLKALITGGVTGGIELIFAYPLEYLKTQLQFGESSTLEKMKTHKTLKDAAKHTLKKYGLRGFYRGISVMLFGNIPKSGARFGTFETVRQYLGDAEGRLTASTKLFGGLLAGVMESIVAVAPMETIKVKVIHDMNREKPRFKGSLDSIITILREEGFKGTYQGLLPTMLKQSTNQGSRFLLMESFKDYYQKGDVSVVVPVYLTLIFGIFTSFFTAYLNSPIDVVKTRMQGLERKRYKNSWDCLVQVFKDGGLRAFYRGSFTRGLRLCVDTMVSFTFFDHVMAYLSKLLP
ncbi:hypothetical protein GE061_009220 [Apolygus lucorum]|uniref:Citrate transport protein n=1 Tax=Apolygus lucorum TaxID=248454 RepID=A0A6A4JTY5_APOLU|nr:hypothetical protein GE061_009220 [Apolygus lucorum]